MDDIVVRRQAHNILKSGRLFLPNLVPPARSVFGEIMHVIQSLTMGWKSAHQVEHSVYLMLYAYRRWRMLYIHCSL